MSRFARFWTAPLLALLVTATAVTAGSEHAVALEKRCNALAQRTEKQLGDAFHIVVEPPFVIAGNMAKKQVASWRDNTVCAAAQALSHKFFSCDPKNPIRILLVSGDAAYRKTARTFFNDKNVSHFGYYRPGNRTMIMNIETGGGTLVHELTHALMAADFPNAPVWFSEAMGSLFEKCRIGQKDIRGLVNWRFPQLAKAVNNGNLIPLNKLVKKSRVDFNGANGGLLYAEARYLALYLQRKGLLAKFYTAFRDHHNADPVGRKTLEKVTGKSLAKLQTEWVKWVRDLAADRKRRTTN